MEMLGAPSMSSSGIYEIRSVYCGVSFAIGLLSLAGFLKNQNAAPGALFILTYAGGYALARFAALPLDGIPTQRLMIFVAFEVISALLALYFLRRLKRSKGFNPVPLSSYDSDGYLRS